jgi:hypothetical protein
MKQSEYNKEHYEKNKDKAAESMKKWRTKNKEHIAVYKKEYYLKNINRRLLENAKKRAKEKGILFDISVGDIVVPTHCPVFGFEFKTGEKTPVSTSPSLDRIVPELGYVKGNIQVISHLANAMKQNATNAQLKNFAQWVLKDCV